MRPHLSLLVLALSSGVSPASAERNLVPSLESEPDVCVERPEEPDWMQNIGVRKAYKRVLVQDIYRAQSLEQIVASGAVLHQSPDKRGVPLPVKMVSQLTQTWHSQVRSFC